MVYFRCTSSGSGKGNTVIVTCAEQFAGVAITIAKIGKSYTKVCPLSAPYVVKFYGVEAGTYTVSATVSGQTYSAEVVVQDVSCVLNYGFTWKTWVDTAQYLDSTDYASLSEVLADEEAVRELFTEHACVDYMADSTSSNADLETIIENDLCAKWINNRDYALDFLGANTAIKALMDTADKYGYGEWIITDDTTTPPTWAPKGNVPVMTANNAPYGEVSTNVTAASGSPAWKVFDGDDSTAFRASSSVSTASITYKFVNPINVRRFKYFVEYSNTPSVTFQMAYSDDGTNFLNAGDAISDTVGQTVRYHNIDDYGYHLYWKLTITFVGDSKVGICQSLQFYGRELSVSVPTMTSNTAPFGEASDSDHSSNDFVAFKAFDGNTSTYWQSITLGNWVQYKFNHDVVLGMVAFQGYSVDNTTKTYQIFGIDSENNAELIYEGTWQNVGTLQVAVIESSKAYKGFRYKVLEDYGTNIFNSVAKTLQFYGKDYSEKEFEVGTTKKWLYDHGVELETLELRKGSHSGNVIEKLSASIICSLQSTPSLNGADRFAVVLSEQNFTPFSLLRAKQGDNYIEVDGKPWLGVCLSTRYPQGGSMVFQNTQLASVQLTSSNMPNNISVDVTSITQSAYVEFGTGYNNGTKCELKELWLE